MSVFKTSNLEIEKKSYKITIKNIDLAGDHWGSEKEMISYLDDVENITLDKENIPKNILKHALKLKHYNPRITDMKFFQIPAEKKMVVLAITKVPRFKQAEFLSREMSITLSDNGYTFSIIELLESEQKEMKEKNLTLPNNWQADEYLNDRYAVMKDLV